jgi:hypothetical protein
MSNHGQWERYRAVGASAPLAAIARPAGGTAAVAHYDGSWGFFLA